jgi:CheY-like chemotaxis protein
MAKKILIADDEQDFLSLIKIRLEAAGYEVTTASDGIEALKQVEKIRPDMVILDILMPKLDGYEVCRLLKFDERYKSLPVVILSARAQDIDKEMGRLVRADAYISKPINDQDLLETIKKQLGE